MTRAVKSDAKGQVAVPAAMRTRLRLQAGDTVFVHLDEETHGVRLAKAINPIDLLYEYAIREYRAGKTTNVRLPRREDRRTGWGRRVGGTASGSRRMTRSFTCGLRMTYVGRRCGCANRLP